jgi:CobQ-like glutamine amidotransferase family enzyme
MKKHALTIGWLYPELMSTYGDRGNIIVLTRRCEWRDIKISLEKISIGTNVDSLKKVDLLFMGGAQDTQQEIVNKDLFERKGNTLRKLIGDSVPGLFICGAYQFLGRYYKTAEGKKLPGLEIFPSYTENPGEKHKRLISNIIIEKNKEKYVGFENHGGRTYLDDPQTAFGTVIKGFGNNGTDKTEGIIFKNSIGTYLHGPILPKNPTLTDWFIQKALERKYDEKIDLKELNDFLEHKAKNTILSRFR